VSSGGPTRQVDQVSDTEAFAYFAQLRAGGRKETAQQPIAVEPLHSVVPVLSATSQPLEDPGQIRRRKDMRCVGDSLARSNGPGIGRRFSRLPRSMIGACRPIGKDRPNSRDLSAHRLISTQPRIL
jgi:hypothetical protein